MTFVDTPRLLHGNTTVLTGTMETRRMWVVALLLVVLAATFHNFAGIAAAAVYAFMLGEIRNLSLRTGGLAGAFWIIALYAFIRLIVPSSVALVPQMEEVLRFSAIALFAATLQRYRARELFMVLTIFLGLMLLLYPVSFVSNIVTVVDASGVRRFSALMPHANHLGYAAASTLIVVFLLRERVEISRLQWWVTLVTCIVLVVLSQSSGALLVVLLGFALFPAAFRPTPSRIGFAIILIISAVLMLASPLGQSALQKILVIDMDRIVLKSQLYQFGDQGSSLAWRISYWLAMIDALAASGPVTVLLGEGGAATARAEPIYFFMTKDPHSDVIKVLIEYGVIGLLLFFGALFTAIWRSRVGVLGFVAFFGPMLVGNSLTSPSVIFILLILVVMIEKFRRGETNGT